MNFFKKIKFSFRKEPVQKKKEKTAMEHVNRQLFYLVPFVITATTCFASYYRGIQETS